MFIERDNAMKKDIEAVMVQFWDDGTFINFTGPFYANKVEIEKFHRRLIRNDTFGNHYNAGEVQVRLMDRKTIHGGWIGITWRLQ